MRKLLLLAAVIVGLVLLSAQPTAQAGGRPCTVPKEWGTLKAMVMTPSGMNQFVAFEAQDGTVRIVNVSCGNPAKADYTMLRD